MPIGDRYPLGCCRMEGGKREGGTSDRVGSRRVGGGGVVVAGTRGRQRKNASSGMVGVSWYCCFIDGSLRQVVGAFLWSNDVGCFIV